MRHKMTNKDKDREAFGELFNEFNESYKMPEFDSISIDSCYDYFIGACKLKQKEIEHLESRELDSIAHGLRMRKEIESLKYELNNSMHFHCPHFLTNGSGMISCHDEKDERIRVLELELSEEKKVVDFYGDHIHWVASNIPDSPDGSVNFIRIQSNDSSVIDKGSDKHGGKLARQRQAKRVEV